MHTNSLNFVWLCGVNRLIRDGIITAPRGQKTYELPQVTYTVDMRHPVLSIPKRKLSYRFMANEAYWILHGDNRVETIVGTNPNIAQFSDDGETFFGAYGPKWAAQRDYVVRKLVEDKSSRQAGVTFWRENPPKSKDIPCTIALFFQIRDSRLHCHTFMRSSDIWLGLPYDVFNFSMLAHEVCAMINTTFNSTGCHDVEGSVSVMPGKLYLTAASSHLYDRNRKAAEEIVSSVSFHEGKETAPTPVELYTSTIRLRAALSDIIAGPVSTESRWWIK